VYSESSREKSEEIEKELILSSYSLGKDHKKIDLLLHYILNLEEGLSRGEVVRRVKSFAREMGWEIASRREKGFKTLYKYRGTEQFRRIFAQFL